MLISVIIPCHNVECYVERAVRSALVQRHAVLELILVDDGSTDGTLERLKELKRSLGERITIIVQPNLGACAARNAGLVEATGEYLQFLDADDVLLPDKLAHQIALARNSELPDIIVGSHMTIDPLGQIVRKEVQHVNERNPWLDLMAHRMGGTCQNLWRTEAVRGVGGWNERLHSSQEYDLMFRMLQHGAKVVHDPEILTEIHQRSSGSISQTGLDQNWIRYVDLRIRIVEHLRTTRPELDLQPYVQVLFDSIRTLYLHAPDKATALYQSHIPQGFVPKRSSATGVSYLLLHHLFGFTLANRIRALLR